MHITLPYCHPLEAMLSVVTGNFPMKLEWLKENKEGSIYSTCTVCSNQIFQLTLIIQACMIQVSQIQWCSNSIDAQNSGKYYTKFQ